LDPVIDALLFRLSELIKTHNEHICGGSVASYEEYRHICGILKGLQMAELELKEVISLSEES
jgi:hypothetical protein